jgi:phenylacetate-coenzyme A ligase PaaK-like adenylate-forming protein
MGFIEVVDVDSGKPVESGEIGSVVITPYYPYRECMPLWRYDTRDVVRRLPDERMTCELAGTPATSRILGKADHLLRLSDRVVTTRDLAEIYEALPSQPWPSRFRTRSVDDHIEMSVPEEALDGISRERIERRFNDAGYDVRIATIADSDDGVIARPVRADLLETTFAGRR